MSNLFFELQDKAHADLLLGNIAACESIFEEAMRSLPDSPFHIALSLAFANPPEDVGNYFDAIFEAESKKYSIGAAYTETNGFDINPDRWFCDVFTFKTYGGREDYDWLSDWQSEGHEDFTLTGMERLQEVYASPAFQDPVYNDASCVSNLIVVTRFQRLVKSAIPYMKNLHFPLLVTSHDFDFIAEFKP